VTVFRSRIDALVGGAMRLVQRIDSMKISAPMRWGLILGLTVALGAACGSSHNMHSDAASAAGGISGGAGASGGGVSGTAGAAGRPGSGGGPGSGGSGGAAVDAGADAPGIRCGSNFCTGSSYCCNPTCGVCAPRGALCTAQICGADALSSFDAFGCVAIPALDSVDCSLPRPPHLYSCIISVLPAPCTVLNIGDVTNTFCCP
jgi:hypothetical protein